MTRALGLTYAVVLTLIGATPPIDAQDQGAERPDAVVVFIADGAGVGHWTLARFARESLAVARMPVVGLVDTRGADHEVSGSAPTATALTTGVRTRMGMIGMGPDSLPRATALEIAHERGWSTGLLTTTAIWDATPAAFAAHETSRYRPVPIFRSMTELPVTVLLGGGTAVFDAAERDSVDLRTPTLQRYRYVTDAAGLGAAAEDPTTGTQQPLLGLFSEFDMPRAGERSPTLTEMTRAAIRVLERDPDGFFLVVENEGSDTEAHANAERSVLEAEMLGFDDAVAVGLELLERRPHTLVLVASDHETGGISFPYQSDDDTRAAHLAYQTGGHTGALVPIFAAGPGAERFSGILDNDEIGRALIELVR